MKIRSVFALMFFYSFSYHVFAMQHIEDPSWIKALTPNQTKSIINAVHDGLSWQFCGNKDHEIKCKEAILAVMPKLLDQQVEILMDRYDEQARFNLYRDILLNAYDMAGFFYVQQQINFIKLMYPCYLSIFDNVLNNSNIKSLYARGLTAIDYSVYDEKKRDLKKVSQRRK